MLQIFPRQSRVQELTCLICAAVTVPQLSKWFFKLAQEVFKLTLDTKILLPISPSSGGGLGLPNLQFVADLAVSGITVSVWPLYFRQRQNLPFTCALTLAEHV